jgi:hypothetical protein
MNGRAGAIDMKRSDLFALAINKRQHLILVAVAATLDRAFLTANEGFIGFDNATNAAHSQREENGHSPGVLFKRPRSEFQVAWVLRLSWAMACAAYPFPAFSEPVPIWTGFALVRQRPRAALSTESRA